MSIGTQKFAIALAILATLAALSVPGIFLWPINDIRATILGNKFVVLALDFLRLLFIILPLAGLLGSVLGRRWSLYCLSAFPIIAWIFGAGAVPLLSHIFSPVTPRTIAITVINASFLGVTLWLLWGRSNNSFKPNPLRGSA